MVASIVTAGLSDSRRRIGEVGRLVPFPIGTALVPMEIPRLLASRAWRGNGERYGDGTGVLLIPGFLAGDGSLTPMASWLGWRRFTPIPSGIMVNVDCTLAIVDRLEQRLEKHMDKTGRKAVVIGQSRGGYIGRILATRRPDLVSGVVMVGSPIADPVGARPALIRLAKRIAYVGDLGVPGLMNDECMHGECGAQVKEQLALPLEVPGLAFHSRNDTVVPWRLAIDPYAENVEIGSAHIAMGVDPDYYTALDGWLRRLVAAG